MNRREFFKTMGGAAAYAAFAGKIEAEASERGPEALQADIEALSNALTELQQEAMALGREHGDNFKNDTLDQLSEEARQRYQSFLERAEEAWEQALELNRQIQEQVGETTLAQYEQYGMSDHPNAKLLRSFSELRPNLLGLLPLRMNIAREALGMEMREYNSPF